MPTIYKIDHENKKVDIKRFVYWNSGDGSAPVEDCAWTTTRRHVLSLGKGVMPNDENVDIFSKFISISATLLMASELTGEDQQVALARATMMSTALLGGILRHNPGMEATLHKILHELTGNFKELYPDWKKSREGLFYNPDKELKDENGYDVSVSNVIENRPDTIEGLPDFIIDRMNFRDYGTFEHSDGVEYALYERHIPQYKGDNSVRLSYAQLLVSDSPDAEEHMMQYAADPKRSEQIIDCMMKYGCAYVDETDGVSVIPYPDEMSPELCEYLQWHVANEIELHGREHVAESIREQLRRVATGEVFPGGQDRHGEDE